MVSSKEAREPLEAEPIGPVNVEQHQRGARSRCVVATAKGVFIARDGHVFPAFSEQVASQAGTQSPGRRFEGRIETEHLVDLQTYLQSFISVVLRSGRAA